MDNLYKLCKSLDLTFVHFPLSGKREKVYIIYIFLFSLKVTFSNDTLSHENDGMDFIVVVNQVLITPTKISVTSLGHMNF